MAASAAIIGFPVFGVPGASGHSDPGRGPVRGAPVASTPVATTPVVPPAVLSHSQPPSTPTVVPVLPGDGHTRPVVPPQTVTHVTPPAAHPSPVQTTTTATTPRTPATPPAASNVATTPTTPTTTTPAPNTTTPAPNTTTTPTSAGPITQQGPGDAHGTAHSNGNSGPAASRQGQSGTGSSCDGLCHNGAVPALSPATVDTATSETVNATPTAVVSIPSTSTPAASIPATPVVSTPTTTPTKPSKGTGPGFQSSSSTKPVGFTIPGTKVGVTSLLSPVLSTAATGTTGATAATLTGLAPATAAVGLNTGAAGAAGPGTHAATTTGTHTRHHSSGSHSGSGTTTIQFIPHLIEHIPAWMWIAIGASLGLAALGAGAAVLTRRRQRAQAGELAVATASALTDPLTGVLNRRGFIEAVERELARARRYSHPFVLAYVDVRGLKAVNDTEGHLVGDELLKNVAKLLSESARADDVVGRLGGDELGLLLVEQTPDAAKAVTRRIEAQVAACRASMALGTHWDLTVGSAAFPQDGQTVDELLGTADRRLYQQRGIELVESR